jgi:hypothetical protein
MYKLPAEAVKYRKFLTRVYPAAQTAGINKNAKIFLKNFILFVKCLTIQ